MDSLFHLWNKIIKYSKSSRSWSSKASPDHNTSTSLYVCQLVLFLKCSISFIPDVTGKMLFKIFSFCLINPHNKIFSKVFGSSSRGFLGKCQTGFCTCCFKQRFWPWNSPMVPFCLPSHSYCWIMTLNSDIYLSKWGL